MLVGFPWTSVHFTLISSASAAQTIPKILNYQARITGATGTALADGGLAVKFTIYDASASGTCLYTTRGSCGTPTAKTVTITGGVFSTLLGDTVSGDNEIPDALFDTPTLYLGITVATDSEMTPRKRLTATPWAFNADRLDNLDTSATGGTQAYIPVTSATGSLTLSADLSVAGSGTFGNLIVNGTCTGCGGGGSSNLNQAYLASTGSPEIALSPSVGAVTIADTFSGTGNIFEIQNRTNSAGDYSQRFLTVSSTSTRLDYANLTSGTIFNIAADELTTGTAARIVVNNLTTGTLLTAASAGTGLTSGSLIFASTATTGALTNGAVRIRGTGAFTSTANAGLLDVQASAATGSGGNATLVNIKSTGPNQIDVNLLNVQASGYTTGYVGNVVSVTGVSTTGTGNLMLLTSANTTNGNALSVVANGLTTGVGQSITSTSAGLTTGSLLRINSDTTATKSSFGIVSFTASSNYSSSGNAGLLNVTADSTTAGVIQQISGTSLTTGTGLAIFNGGSGLTSGSLLRITTGTTGAVATNGIVSLNASGNYTSTSNAGLLNVLANSTTAGTIQHISGTSLTTGRAVQITNGLGMTTGSGLVMSGATYNHTTTETGSLVSLSLTDASSGLGGTATTNGLNIATTFNSSSGMAKVMNALNIPAPTITACGTASCNWTALNAATAALTQTSTNVFTMKGLDITAGALTQNLAAGQILWTGLNVSMPNITQTTGTVTSTGLKISGNLVASGTTYAILTGKTAGDVGLGTMLPGAQLTVADKLVAPTGNIFEVQNTSAGASDAYTERYFTVSSTSTRVFGNLEVFGSCIGCSGGTTNLNQAYLASTGSPEIAISPSIGAVTIADTIGGTGNIFELQNRTNSAGDYSARYMTVSSTSTFINPNAVSGYKLAVGNASPTATLDITGQANTPGMKLSGFSTTGTDTMVDLAGTWNNAAANLIGMRINMTNTASLIGSQIMQAQINGNTRFFVDKFGSVGSITDSNSLIPTASSNFYLRNDNSSTNNYASINFAAPNNSWGGIAGKYLSHEGNGQGELLFLVNDNAQGTPTTRMTIGATTTSVTNDLVIGTSSSGAALNVTNAGAGFPLRVNDNGTLTDATPFMIDASGNVGIGSATPSAKLDVAGEFQFSLLGTGDTTIGVCKSTADSVDGILQDPVTLVDCSGTPGDMAEWYPTSGPAVAGEIMVATDKTLTYKSKRYHPLTGLPLGFDDMLTVSVLDRTAKPYDDRVIGVVSTNPVQTFGQAVNDASSNTAPIALIGRVPLKVSTENGPIKAGDPITTSSVAGVGMKSTKPGMIVGTALAGWNGPGQGTILVFVNVGWRSGEGTSHVSIPAFDADTPFISASGTPPLASASSLMSSNGLWSISADGMLTARTVETEVLRTEEMMVVQSETKSAISEGMVPKGKTSVVIKNAAMKPGSKVFVSFLADSNGNWWITDKGDGVFTFRVKTAPKKNLPFEYWIVGVDDQRPKTPTVK